MSSRPPRKPESRALRRFSMRSPSTRRRLASAGPLALLIVAALDTTPRHVLAQEKPAASKAAGVFEDDAKTPEAKKPAEKKPAVSDRETIGFTQENVAAQMTELEERMFRLS